MHLRTTARDCLYLNWALPAAAAPALPPPLRYQVHAWEGRDYVFASALLYRLSGLHLETFPILRLSYPQMSFRLYVLDGDDVSSVLFLRVLVPFWVVPMSRWVARQPASAAAFSYPAPSDQPGADSWSWSIRRRCALQVEGRLASPQSGFGPQLGPWPTTLDYFRRRPRAYVLAKDRLRPVTSSQPSVDVWPLAVTFGDVGLLSENFGGVDPALWHSPHSAWLCPEIPFNIELGELVTLPIAQQQAAATGGV